MLHAYRFDRYKRTVREPARDRAAAGQRAPRRLGAGPQRAPWSPRRRTARATSRTRRRMTSRRARSRPTRRRRRRGSSGLTAEIVDEDGLRETGMGAFAAVAQGSEQPAQLIRLDYEGPGAGDGPRLALIGKAVTFDTGGISLKPPAKMFEMKFDMAGGGAVIEAIAAIAELELPVRVLGGRRRDREHARAAAPSSRATSSPPWTARRSRSTTPTPRAGSCSPTASPMRGARAAIGSSTSRP